MNYSDILESFTSKVIKNKKEETQEDKRESLFNIKQDIIECLNYDLHLESYGIDNGIGYLGHNHKYLKYYEKDSNFEIKHKNVEYRIYYMLGFEMRSDIYNYTYCPIILMESELIGIEVLVYDNKKYPMVNPILKDDVRDDIVRSYYFDSYSDYGSFEKDFWSSIAEIMNDWIFMERNQHPYFGIEESFTSDIINNRDKLKDEVKKSIGKVQTLEDAEIYFRKVANENGYYIVNTKDSMTWREVDNYKLKPNQIKIFYNGRNIVPNICYTSESYYLDRTTGKSKSRKVKHVTSLGLGVPTGEKKDLDTIKIFASETEIEKKFYSITGKDISLPVDLYYGYIDNFFKAINLTIKEKKLLHESFTNKVIDNIDSKKDEIKNSLSEIEDGETAKNVIKKLIEKNGVISTDTKSIPDDYYASYDVEDRNYVSYNRSFEILFTYHIYYAGCCECGVDDPATQNYYSIHVSKVTEFPDKLFATIANNWQEVYPKNDNLKVKHTIYGYLIRFDTIKCIVDEICDNAKEKSISYMAVRPYLEESFTSNVVNKKKSQTEEEKRGEFFEKIEARVKTRKGIINMFSRPSDDPIKNYIAKSLYPFLLFNVKDKELYSSVDNCIYQSGNPDQNRLLYKIYLTNFKSIYWHYFVEGSDISFMNVNGSEVNPPSCLGVPTTKIGSGVKTLFIIYNTEKGKFWAGCEYRGEIKSFGMLKNSPFDLEKYDFKSMFA